MTLSLSAAVSNPGMAFSAGASMAGSASAAVSGMLGSPGAPKNYGLTHRFKVTLKGARGSLGEWTSVDGLGVQFQHEQNPQGSDHEQRGVMPGKLTYNNITLKRPISGDSFTTMMKWISDVRQQWLNRINAPTDTSDPASTPMNDTMTIDLFGVAATGTQVIKVATWTLTDVLPVSWSAPSLSADKSNVAIETLVIRHGGFLDSAGASGPTGSGSSSSSSPSSSSAQQPGGAGSKLTLDAGGGPTDKVVFDYTPAAINFSKGQVTNHRGTIQQTQEQAVTDIQALTFSIPDLRLEGKNSLVAIGKLFGWLVLQPGPNSPPAGSSARSGDNQRGVPKVLTLSMGTGKGMQYGDGIGSQVILKKLEVSYTRFDQAGDPIRAKIGLTLEMVNKAPQGTNPTSHSPGGGRVHTTTAGDSLARIAQSTYSNPGAWRDIAAANDIDDPLRVRNGRTLFLPYSRAQSG